MSSVISPNKEFVMRDICSRTLIPPLLGCGHENYLAVWRLNFFILKMGMIITYLSLRIEVKINCVLKLKVLIEVPGP